MAAWVIGSGVVKSGSPIVRQMTSFISSSMSKKRRMPDGWRARTLADRKRADARTADRPSQAPFGGRFDGHRGGV